MTESVECAATPTERPRLPLPTPYRAEVLKEDLTSRVERVHGERGTFVRKTYAPRPLFLWRTFLRPAKARREHDNLRALEAAGVPVTRALAWEEERRFGFVPQSRLWLEDAGEVRNLKDALAAGAPRTRAALLAQYAALLRALHERGFVSLTAYPRNVVVAGGRLLLCDQPYLVRRRAPVGRAAASIDLYDALFTPGRVRALGRSERLRALVAYAGERRAAYALWRRLVRRPAFWQRFLKGCIKVGSRIGLWSRQP
ncbi:MAG TPA: lipopolysaccharide kinase InaA family protein [Planctomycetota bacterium]|nr:lipopolysaccharide kinase InaA family protein [Planctomycetota bacterium]